MSEKPHFYLGKQITSLYNTTEGKKSPIVKIEICEYNNLYPFCHIIHYMSYKFYQHTQTDASSRKFDPSMRQSLIISTRTEWAIAWLVMKDIQQKMGGGAYCQ